jgi:glycosyltransferase involved in cell wall biosynthesis
MTTATRRPVRVIHVTNGLDMGGLEKLLVEFARHADRQRHKLRFVSLGTRGLLASEIERHGWPVTALAAPTGFRPQLILRLASLFRCWDADVVHTHNTRALIYGGPAARLARAPRLIHTWHGQDVAAATRGSLLFRLAGRLPDRIVAVSQDAAAWMMRVGIAGDKIQAIRNGIDLTRFAHVGPCEGGSVVTVARLSPEKDVATLIKAAALVRRERPAFRVEIAGDGPCLPALGTLAGGLGLEDHVRFLGQVSDVPALLARAALFVLPSLTEGLSLTLLEAMARGLPVVATRAGGNPEVVSDGETGWLVPPGDAEELARAILYLLQDRQAGREMGQAGRRRAEQRFDIRRVVAAYEALYHEGQPLQARASEQRPRVVSNMPGLSLPPAAALLRNICTPPSGRSVRDAVRTHIQSLAANAVVIDQEPATLLMLCALRTLLPLPYPPLVSLDLVLSRPDTDWMGRVKGLAKRWLLRQVSRYLVHMKDTRAWRSSYGIAAPRTRYVPFKVNGLADVLSRQVHEHPYVFTGGKSRRDYQTFCQAMALTGYPALIVTPLGGESAAHGTRLGELRRPPNVALVHDDGSHESWVRQLAGAKVVVFCIAPQTISPSGVSAYLLAMALRKCVIISDCPATRGILVPDETAILVPMQDPAAVAEAVRKAWCDDAYRRRIAEGGYRYALSLGGEDVLVGNVAREVIALLGKRGSANRG